MLPEQMPGIPMEGNFQFTGAQKTIHRCDLFNQSLAVVLVYTEAGRIDVKVGH